MKHLIEITPSKYQEAFEILNDCRSIKFRKEFTNKLSVNNQQTAFDVIFELLENGIELGDINCPQLEDNEELQEQLEMVGA